MEPTKFQFSTGFDFSEGLYCCYCQECFEITMGSFLLSTVATHVVVVAAISASQVEPLFFPDSSFEHHCYCLSDFLSDYLTLVAITIDCYLDYFVSPDSLEASTFASILLVPCSSQLSIKSQEDSDLYRSLLNCCSAL